MTREEILSAYKVNEHGMITSPGKFEGEMIYAPYFYDLMMNGLHTEHEEYNEYDELTYHFDILKEDIDIFPELIGVARVYLFENNDGFVSCGPV